MSKSLIAYLVCIAFVLYGGLCYYPKWKLERSEATISWDVSGYYYYLPAFLIYHDAKQLNWHDEILNKYYPGPGDQAYRHSSGNMVMKYSAGLALQYLPFFLIADQIAKHSSYPADGFSRPYQLAISLGSLLMACLGLWLLRLMLHRYFADGIVAAVLITITLGTNYLDYASINHAMTHNWLFTWYAALLYFSDAYWKQPSVRRAVPIGLAVGLMALTRPSEAVALLLPLLWGITSWRSFKERIRVLLSRWKHVLCAGIAFALMGMVQAIYWKYATGEWIVYSYQDQGFSWLHPHVINGMFSYRAGWLVYTPVMILALIGFYFLWKNHKSLLIPLGVLSVVFMYITWAWDIWWYGGSLGQRAMVQLYPVLAFPMAVCLEKFNTRNALRVITSVFIVLCIYYNLWLTHQAHRGGLLRAGEMTRAYFWKVLGKYQVEKETQFLLDNPDVYRGLGEGRQIFSADFENLETEGCLLEMISGRSLCLGPEVQFSPQMSFEIPAGTRWLRATATFRAGQKEWDTWKMTQFRLHLMQGDQQVRTRVIRVFRGLNDGDTQRFSVDLKIPSHSTWDHGMVDLWNSDSQKYLVVDDLIVKAY